MADRRRNAAKVAGVGIRSDTIGSMDGSEVLRRARRRSGLSLRQLAQRAGTSHSAIAAYESGAKVPGSTTLDRLVRACGLRLEPALHATGPFTDRVARG